MSDSRALWLAVRQALLMIVDAIERVLGIAPRTAELRKRQKGSAMALPEEHHE